MIKNVEKRVVVKVDLEFKNKHTFSDGNTIIFERNWNNLDKKHTSPVQGTVISADHIPEGAELLFHHNCCIPTNELFNSGALSGAEIASQVRVFSIPEEQAYLWRKDSDEWNPIKGFATGLRVFRPYIGVIQNVEPTKIKDMLYITSGEYKGIAVRTVKAADMPIIFRNEKGVEEIIIRCRHFENEDHEREEIIALDHWATEEIKECRLLVGVNKSDCKPLNKLANVIH